MRVRLILAGVDVDQSCRIRAALFVARVRGCLRGRRHDHRRCRPMSHPQTKVRVLDAGLRALDVPEEPVARLWHAATLLREHRGDGHNAALLAHGIGGIQAHVLMALALGMRAEEFGRIHHLPKAQLAAVIDGLRGRGLVDAAGGFTDTGRKTSERIEAVTDELAAPAYDVLSADELDELIAGLEPIAAAARAADD